MDGQKALLTLTIYVGIFTVGRLVVGLLLRIMSSKTVLVAAAVLALTGGIISIIAESIGLYTVGLLCIGFGLSAGFPIVLGMVGDRFPSWTGLP